MRLGILHEGSQSILYLDLDETLIHTVFNLQQPEIDAHEYVKVKAGYTFARPGLYDFLSKAQSKGYTLVLITHGTRDYAHEVLEKLIIDMYFSKVYTREDVIEMTQRAMFDFGKTKLPDGTLIDNEMPMTKVSLIDGPKLRIKSWNYKDKADTELMNMLSNL